MGYRPKYLQEINIIKFLKLIFNKASNLNFGKTRTFRCKNHKVKT